MSATKSSTLGFPAGPDERRAAFVTTHWSVVRSAACSGQPEAPAALAHLCETYWYPLYAYVRSRGHSPEDAQDLTQEFFLRVLEKGTLAQADPLRGRFRSFLLGSLNHFLAHQWEKGRALKRGGGQTLIPLDVATAEQWYAQELAEQRTPDKAFEKRWALALLREVLGRLEREYCQLGKEALFNVLKETIAGPRESQPNAELARRLQMTEGAVKVAVHRLRKRYRQLLRAEIAATVATHGEAAEELAHLFEALR